MEDDPAWHGAEIEDEDASETSNYSMLPAYLAAPKWHKCHAALIALAQIVEGCSKAMIKNLEQVVAMVLTSFPDQHPHVRWADINAIGQLSTDLGPDLQVKYHQGVLPALAGATDDF
ncbi:hypothetical protein JHK82_031912 [Glycine max]|nr:hypothetical protein JHK86_032008 [Glycine max]KAG5125175.1 hypothetical protein JHK82_031912 [Glycine max]